MSTRQYVVGLPVVVDIDDDGHVRVEVDTSELGVSKVLAEHSEYDDETIDADADLLHEWVRTHDVVLDESEG